jgi:hypothetical protein
VARLFGNFVLENKRRWKKSRDREPHRTMIEISSSTHCDRWWNMRLAYRRKLVIVNAIILFRGSHPSHPSHLLLGWESLGKTQQGKGKYSHWWKKPKINPASPGLIRLFYHDISSPTEDRRNRHEAGEITTSPMCLPPLTLPLSLHQPASKLC